jgi:leader peptidase (prepilin peptidase)/N-methyltransferase
MFYVWLVMVFLIGAAVGSFLNVCVFRLPYEKSLLWPGSRCGRCFQPVGSLDNIPLVSYWILRGRCRHCGERFSIRYFLVELFTALAFVGLFYLEVGQNVLELPLLNRQRDAIAWGLIPWQAWVVFAYHALLLSFLLVCSLCDLNDMEIPLTVTVTGTLVGLVGATLLAWPFPDETVVGVVGGRGALAPRLTTGLYPWPVWWPLPTWLPPGSWRLGLLTGLAGAAAGMAALRGVRLLFGLGRGVEGLGVGDADLMMMAGSFVGWQPILVAFLVGVFPALFFGIAQLIRRGEQAMPFGPSLAIGVMLTLLLWPTLGDSLRLFFFDPLAIGVLGGGGGVMLLVISFLLRLVRGVPDQVGQG